MLLSNAFLSRPFPSARLGAVALSCLLGAGGAMADSRAAWKTGSDLLAVGLPIVAAGHAWSEDDGEGLKQLGLALGGTFLSTELIKSQVHETRPDGSGDDSFPSGHTAIAFAAARYVDKRYGGPWRLALYTAAGLTGVARVEADQHHWKDVLAGAALGYLASELSTRSRSFQVVVAPTPRGVALVGMAAW